MDHQQELAAFGWWFASAKFDDSWALDQVLQILELVRKVEPDHLIAPRLVETVAKQPLQSLHALAGLIEADQEGWSIRGWEDEANAVLKAALESDNQQARDEAKELIHRLGARGFWRFRDLL